MFDLILRGARLDGGLVDVAVAGGRIERVAPGIEGSATREVDAGGRLFSPPFVESHVHLDTTLTAGQPRWNGSGTLFEGIQIWTERKEELSHRDVIDRATQLLRWQAAQGVLHVRTHASVLALDIKIPRHILTVIVGVLATAFTIYLVFAGSVAEQLEAWLVGVVAWVSPWAAIMLVHFYIIRRENVDIEALYQSPSESRVGDVNWAAMGSP